MRAKLPYHYYNRAFERMDPKLAKALREGVATTAGSFGFCSTCDTPSVSLEVSKVSVSSCLTIPQLKKFNTLTCHTLFISLFRVADNQNFPD